MNSRTGSPNHHRSAASRKNRMLRETSEASAKASEVELRDAAGDRDELVGDRRQPLEDDDPGAPLRKGGLERLVFVHRVVEFEHRPADRVEQEIADRIADKPAERPRRSCRRPRSARPGAAAPGSSGSAGCRAAAERTSSRRTRWPPSPTSRGGWRQAQAPGNKDVRALVKQCDQITSPRRFGDQSLRTAPPSEGGARSKRDEAPPRVRGRSR